MATIKTNTVTVNGKEIKSIEDLPPEIRDLIDKNRDGKIDGIMDLIKNASQAKPLMTALQVETPTMTKEQVKELASIGSFNPDPQLTSSTFSWLQPFQQLIQMIFWLLMIGFLVKELFPDVWTQLNQAIQQLGASLF